MGMWRGQGHIEERAESRGSGELTGLQISFKDHNLAFRF
jgi:hypothetical protein